MKYLKTAGMKKYAKAMGNVCSVIIHCLRFGCAYKHRSIRFPGPGLAAVSAGLCGGRGVKVHNRMDVRQSLVPVAGMLRAKTVQPQRSVPRVCQGKYRKIPSG